MTTIIDHQYNAKECIEYAISCIKNKDSRACTLLWLERAKKRLAEQENWLDQNTTFYDVPGRPVLEDVSKRIWYHATDDQTSYPFSAVITNARAK